MNLRLHHLGGAFAVCLLVVPLARAQEDPLKDPDLQEALKQAQELQKNSTPAKMSDLKKKADEITAEQAAGEKQEDQKRKAALQKQLEAPGPVALPDWTPATPQFTVTGSLAKKIVEDEVKIVLTGTSPLTPEEILKAWQSAMDANPLKLYYEHGYDHGTFMATTTRLYVYTRPDRRQTLMLKAVRDRKEKVTHINISLNLLEPGADGE